MVVGGGSLNILCISKPWGVGRGTPGGLTCFPGFVLCSPQIIPYPHPSLVMPSAGGGTALAPGAVTCVRVCHLSSPLLLTCHQDTPPAHVPCPVLPLLLEHSGPIPGPPLAAWALLEHRVLLIPTLSVTPGSHLRGSTGGRGDAAWHNQERRHQASHVRVQGPAWAPAFRGALGRWSPCSYLQNGTVSPTSKNGGEN